MLNSKNGAIIATATAAFLPSGHSAQSEMIFPPVPHQPINFTYPKKQFGTKNILRSSQANFFFKWPFLHYNESRDLVYCHVCMVAVQTNRLKGRNADAAFVSLLFYNYPSI